MDIHTMQHLYIVRKNISTNSWPQLLNSWSWLFKLVATTFESRGKDF